MYLLAKRDGVDFNLASIGDDFDVPYKGPFDKEYMQTLSAGGYQKGRAGYPWQKAPPRPWKLVQPGATVVSAHCNNLGDEQCRVFFDQ
jgi:hypothetical protein